MRPSLLSYVLALVLVLPLAVYAAPALTLDSELAQSHDSAQLTFLDATFDSSLKGICPSFDVRCVKDGDWRHPIGKLGAKPFCREGLRCNQCEEHKNTRECNVTFKDCEGECQAYGPIPF